MTTPDLTRSRAWCVFRNLVHAVYREARHLGPQGDADARATVPDGKLADAAARCQKRRAELKARDLHGLTRRAVTTAEVLQPYQDRTGLTIDDLIDVFALPNWKPRYGGPKWRSIAKRLRELTAALDAGDIERASQISETVASLKHNSGPLVPSRSDWERRPYLQEKWPELCE